MKGGHVFLIGIGTTNVMIKTADQNRYLSGIVRERGRPKLLGNSNVLNIKQT
jgi:hypothetical protein